MEIDAQTQLRVFHGWQIKEADIFIIVYPYWFFVSDISLIYQAICMVLQWS